MKRPNKNYFWNCAFWIVATLLGLVVPVKGAAATAANLLTDTQKAGVVVMVDCSKALVEEVFAYGPNTYKIYARFSDKAEYDALMATATAGVKEAVTVRLFPEYIPTAMATLPFPDHFANVIIVNNTTVPDAECERVVSPNFKYYKTAGGDITSGYPKTKAMPSDMANNSWTNHDLHRDLYLEDAIGFPFLSKWAQDPMQYVRDGIAVHKGVYFCKEMAKNQTTGSWQTRYGLVARSAFNGELLWSIPATFTNYVGPVTTGYVGRIATGAMSCYNHYTGAVVWSANVSGITYPTFIGVSDDILFFYNNATSTLMGWDTNTQSQLWVKTGVSIFPSGSSTSSYAKSCTAAAGRVYVALLNGTIAVYDAVTGAAIGNPVAYTKPSVTTKVVQLSSSGPFVYLNNSENLTASKYEMVGNQLTKVWDSTKTYGYLAIYPDGKIGSYKSLWEADGQTKIKEVNPYGCAGTFFNSQYMFGQYGPEYDYTNDKETPNFANKASCASGAGEGGFVGNNNIFQSSSYCRCHIGWTLYGLQSNGKGDTGFSYDRIPPSSERLFMETDGTSISSPMPSDSLDWTSFRKDNQHSGATKVSLKHSVDGTLTYTPPVAGKVTPPVTAGDYCFVGYEDGKVRCLNVTTAGLVWEYQTGGEIKVSPTVWNHRLYVGSEDGFLYCFEAATGRLLWRFMGGPQNRKVDIYGKLKSTWPINSTVLIDDGVAYFAAGRQYYDGTFVYAMNPLTGEVIWQKNIGVTDAPVNSEAHQYGNATTLSIGKGHLWVGSFRWCFFVGLKIADGSIVRQSYMRKENNLEIRGVYTAFFRDYFYCGGTYLYDIPYELEYAGADIPKLVNGGEGMSFFKIKADGTMQTMANSESRVQEPEVNGLQSGAWDEDVFFTGKYLFDADKFEMKLDRMYDVGFAIDSNYTVFQERVQWLEWNSVMKYTNFNYTLGDPVLAKNALMGVTSDYKLRVHTRDASHTKSVEVAMETAVMPDGVVVNRNGVIVVPLCNGKIVFVDAGNAPAQYALTVSGGTGSGTYTEGLPVAIAADAAPGGQLFNQWSGDPDVVAGIDDPYASSTNIVMPQKNATVTAIFSVNRTLTVNGGSGSCSSLPFRTIAITANPAPAGQTFDKWTGVPEAVAALDAVDAATANFTMLDADVVLTATYKPLPTFPVVVVGGSGDGTCYAGQQINLSADAAPAGKVFYRWVSSGGGEFGQRYQPDTSYTMPEIATVLTPEYIDMVGSYLVNFGPVAVGSASSVTWNNITATTGGGSSVAGLKTVGNAGSGIGLSLGGNWQETADLGVDSDAVFPAVAQKGAMLTTVSDEAGTVTLTGLNNGYYYNFEIFCSLDLGVDNAVEITLQGVTKTVEAGGNASAKVLFGDISPVDGAITIRVKRGSGGLYGVLNVLKVTEKSSATEYALSVVNGSGGGNFVEGAIVYLSANEAPAGMRFTGWSGDTQAMEGASIPQPYLVMPAGPVSVKANYGYIPDVGTLRFDFGATATTLAGWNNIIAAQAGEVLTSVLDSGGETKGVGFRLGTGWKRWDVANATVCTAPYPNSAMQDALQSVNGDADRTITFTGLNDARQYRVKILSSYHEFTPANVAFSAEAVTGTVNTYQNTDQMVVLDSLTPVGGEIVVHADVQSPNLFGRIFLNLLELEEISTAGTHSLGVTGGTGDGSYAEGTQVTIVADTPPEGQVFMGWSGDIEELADPHAVTTTLVMPGHTVNVAAVFAVPGSYYLGVVNGSGAGTYAERAPVVIVADAAPTAMVFDRWTGDVTTVANVYAPSTTLLMPSAHSTVTASYKSQYAAYDYVVSSALDSGDGSLRDAVTMASPGQVIGFSTAVTTVTLASEIVIDKQVVIDGGSRVSISGGWSGGAATNGTRIFAVAGNGNLELRGLTLKNAYKAGANMNEYGGAILNNGTLALKRCAVKDSKIFVNMSGAILTDKYACGAAVASTGTAASLMVEESSFSNNLASGMADGDTGDPDESYGFGGAIYADAGTVSIKRSLFAGNSAGGVSPGTPGGGAVYLGIAGTTSIENSTFVNNSTIKYGGAIYTVAGTLNVYNSTIYANTPGSAGGMVETKDPATMNFYSCIIIGSTAGGDLCVDSETTPTLLDRCLISSTATKFKETSLYFADATAAYTKEACQATDSPLLGTLADNGGLTQTIGLQAESPAIGKGSNPKNLETDQRGLGYARVNSGTTDIGAYEIQTTAADISVSRFGAIANGGTDGFGAIPAGGATRVAYTVSSCGTQALALALPVTVGAQTNCSVAVATTPSASIPAGSTTAFAFDVTPASVGAWSFQVSVASDAPGKSPYTFVVSGTAQANVAEISVLGNGAEINSGDASPTTADHTDFGVIPAGSWNQRVFTIKNTGLVPFDLTGTPKVALVGSSDFVVTEQPALSTVPAISSVTFTVAYNPSGEGSDTATVSIANTDSDEGTYSFAISGSAVPAPEIVVSGNGVSIAKGDDTPSVSDGTDFGAAASKTFTVSNTGVGDLALTGTPKVSVLGSGAFTVTEQPASPVAAGGSTSFTVAYNSASAEPAQALVRILSDDSDEGAFSFNIKADGFMPGVDTSSDDLSAPGIAISTNADNSKILVFFTEPVDLVSAQVAGNYTVSGGVTVSNAMVDPRNPNLVVLTTSGFTSSKTVTINNVKDLASNVIASNATVTMRYTAAGGQLLFENMDTNPGWSTEGLWAWGQPTGVFTSDATFHFRYDPVGGYNGTNAYAYGLSANYENNLMEKHLTTPVISSPLQGLSNIRLKFWRWLGVDADDAASIKCGSGSVWSTIWSNQAVSADYPQQKFFGNSWVYTTYDITQNIGLNVANSIRWTMGNTDDLSAYGGWNLDEVEVSGKYDGTDLPPRIEVQEGQQVTVAEGEATTLHVRLASAPVGTVSVEVEKMVGSADFVTSGSPSFTAADYSTWKPISITKLPDSNAERDRAMFRLVSRGKITGFGVVNGGENYFPGAVGNLEFVNTGQMGERAHGPYKISLNGGGGTGATAVVAEEAPGRLHCIRTVKPGSGYTSLPTVTITSTNGSGAVVPIDDTDMETRLDTVTITNQGSGYTSAPTVTITPVGGSVWDTNAAAKVEATVSGGKVTELTIKFPGSYWFSTTAFTVAISGGGGSGATATATLTKGLSLYFVNITPSFKGKGYTYGDITVTVSGGGGSGAVVCPVIYSEGIKKMAITNNGSGYTSAPTVEFKSCVTPAVLAPVLNAAGTTVVGATIVDPGSGYEIPPVVNYSDGTILGNQVGICEITNGQVTKVNFGTTIAYSAAKQLYTWPGHPLFLKPAATATLGNPVVSITGGDGADSTGTATASAGAITAVSTASTVGYKYPPKVEVTGGTGADVYARIEGGAQYCFDVIEVESGSNLPPTPTVTSPADALSNICLTDSLYLMGGATDATGMPGGSITYAWSLVSGPGTATFGTPNAKDSTVSFSMAGDYVVRLTTSDGQYSSSVDRRILVTNAPITGTLRGIAGYYPLDEASGATVAVNKIDSAKNGSYEGAPTLSDTGGRFGGCVTTSGTNAVILGDALDYSVAPTSQYTVSFWFKASAEATKYIFGKGSKNGSKELVIYTATGSIKAVVGGQTKTGTVAYGDNAWHHLAVVNTGSIATLYLDGTALVSDNCGTDLSPGMDFVLGAYRTDANNTGLSTGFVGSVDDARIYSAALTANEIAALAAAVDGETPPIITQNSATMANIGETVLFSAISRNPAGVVVVPASQSWTVVSAPVGGTYTFTDPTAQTQEATFFKKGTYRIRYVAKTEKFASVSEFDILVGIPVVTQQPQSVAIIGGQSANLSVAAYGSSLTYQWYEGNSGNTATPVFGATSTSFTTPALIAQKSYWCRVTNASSGGTADSDAATISIIVPPVVDSQPAGQQTVNSGSGATLSVSSSTPGATYQWYEGTSGDTSKPVAGGTTATITPSVTAPKRFWCRITNAAGTSDSETAEVAVRYSLDAVADTYIRGSATYNTANYGSIAYVYMRSGIYNASTDYRALMKWDMSAIDSSFVVDSAELSVNVSTAGATTTNFYECKQPWVEAQATYLNYATGLVWPLDAGAWGTSSFGNTVLASVDPSTTGVKTAALNASGVAVVQSWLSNSANNKGLGLINSGAVLIKIDSKEAASKPQLKVVCKLPAGPSITSEPDGATISTGGTHSMSVTATGATGYQWYEGARGDTSTPISGATTANYTTPALTETATYWVKVTGTNGTFVYSDAATVTVAVDEPEMGVNRSGDLPDGGADSVAGTVATIGTQLTYTIANGGALGLTLSNAVISGASNCSVAVDTQPAATVAPAANTSLVLTVTPSSAGAWSFVVSVANNDANENPYNWTVGGAADPAPAPEMAVSRAFAVDDGGADAVSDTLAGSGSQLTYTISNAGNAALTLGTVTTGSTVSCAVSIGTQPAGSVAVSGSTNLVLTVTPSAAGVWSFVVSVPSNDADENPYNWTASGTAGAPAPEMAVTRVGAVADGGADSVEGTVAGAGTQLTYTVSNSGNGALSLTGATAGSQTNCGVVINTQPSASVAAGGNSSLVLTVTPAAAGAWSFTLSVPSNDADENPYNWTVGGMATPALGGFDAWASGKGLSGGAAGLLADADGDGMVNLVEFALNADPTAADGSRLPAVAVEGSNLVLRYRKNKGASGLVYAVESSSDLATWAQEGEGNKESDPDAETEVWKVSKPAGTKLFLRLKISKP